MNITRRIFLFLVIFCATERYRSADAIELSLEISASNLTCAAYTCKNADQKFINDTCVYYDRDLNAYFSKKCSDTSKACLLEGEHPGNYTCQPYISSNGLSWPGEPCTTITDCEQTYSKACTGGICVGYPVSATCEDSNYCQPGNSCRGSPLTCQAQIQVGSTGCLSDADCTNDAACNITSNTNGALNACLPAFSIQPHQPVGGCVNGVSNLCRQVTCAAHLGGFYCTDQVFSDYNVPKPCDLTKTGQCVSTEDEFFTPAFQLISDCECGYNREGLSYCALFPGDGLYQAYINTVVMWLNSTGILKCNTLRRDQTNCMKSYMDAKQFNRYVYYEFVKELYPKIYQSEDCVVDTVTSFYAKARDNYDADNEDFAVSIAGITFLLGLALN
ncbi:unnamed protein product [Blepharisma stoltei]|uniref:Dickkopf N-terminal cysteine-rich domain-containing protein n=1 Tax=Blepharisma stoltei TaxID=1481888 RepID=A0AAU9JR98_9CILI|nr:unnamed protein product [Blepharisma stoltei]